MASVNEKRTKYNMEAVSSKVTAFCDANILGKYMSVIAGVSGGADSLCMLLLLERYCKKNGIKLVCAHFNHKLRGEDADEDERFVENVCRGLGVEFRSEFADVASYAKTKGISTEMAGRELRYAFFGRLADEYSDAAIAVAHTRNDKAETVFLNIARGSGTEGLKGIASVNGRIIRPIIGLSREETEYVCNESGYEFRIDSTNSENIYKRNIVRNVIIPQTEEYFPGFSERLISMSEITSEENSFIAAEAEKGYGRCAEEHGRNGIAIDSELFAKEHPVLRNRIVRMAAERITEINGASSEGFDRQNTERCVRFILTGETGKILKLPKGVRCRKDYGKACFYVDEQHEDEKKRGETGGPEMLIDLNEIKKRQTVSFFSGDARYEITYSEDPESIGDIRKTEGNKTAYFDADELEKELVDGEGRACAVIRKQRTGDVFKACGAPGEKPLRRFFTDAKIPAEKRKDVTVMASGNRILWIPEIRRSDDAKVEKKTKRVIIIKCVHYTERRNARMYSDNLNDYIDRVLVTKEEIEKEVARLGKQISEDYAGKELVLIGVLKGGFVFMSDLVRHITIPVDLDFIAVSSYGASTKSSGVVRLIKDVDHAVAGKNVLIVEDIVDTGLTLSYLKQLFEDRHPESVRIVTAFDKPSRRKVELVPEYKGIEIPDEYVIGYGLDYDNILRNIPDLCVLKREVYEKTN